MFKGRYNSNKLSLLSSRAASHKSPGYFDRLWIVHKFFHYLPDLPSIQKGIVLWGQFYQAELITQFHAHIKKRKKKAKLELE